WIMSDWAWWAWWNSSADSFMSLSASSKSKSRAASTAIRARDLALPALVISSNATSYFSSSIKSLRPFFIYRRQALCQGLIGPFFQQPVDTAAVQQQPGCDGIEILQFLVFLFGHR